MADLSITAASVVLVSGPTFQATAGEAITAGQAVYNSAATTVKKAQTDGTSAEAAATGIALNGGGTGQPIVCAGEGARVTLAGATTAAGVIYYVSNGAGGICPIGDIGSADYVSALGYATDTAGAFTIRITNTGQVLA
jgi:hypothetical protein